jgi:hypothetical protein
MRNIKERTNNIIIKGLAKLKFKNRWSSMKNKYKIN